MQIDKAASPRRGTVKVPLRIDHDAVAPTAAFPMSVGVPCVRGTVRGEVAATLHGSTIEATPVQTAPLIHWPDGSVQWLLCDFVAPPELADADDLCFEIVPLDRSSNVPPALLHHVEEGRHHVDTGSHRFSIPRDGLQPFSVAGISSAAAARSCGSELVLTDRHGRPHRPQLDDWRVETVGPVRLTIVGEGHFAGVDGLRLRLRESFFSETGLVRLDITLHNPRRARHRGGLWDLGDSGSVLFQDLSLALELPNAERKSLSWSITPGEQLGRAEVARFALYQASSGGENWNSRNHVNREGRVPCQFRGFRLSVDDRQTAGLRASPTICVAAGDLLITAAFPEFWQQFPKAVTIDADRLRLGLFPREYEDLFELQGGERKTHTIWLQFADRSDTSSDTACHALEWVHSLATATQAIQATQATQDGSAICSSATQDGSAMCPIRLRPTSEWCEASGALPALGGGDRSSQDHLRTILAEARRGQRSIQDQRESVDEYGWRNYGDLFADHEQLHYHNRQPLISHYNNQFDVLVGFLIQSLRTSDSDWWQWGNALARHVVDIDIYHTDEDRPAYNGGLFWFTDHYLHAHTSTHRTYSKSNRSSWRQRYGGGPSAEHNFTSGLLLHYGMTGNRDSRDAVITLAEWVIAMDDGRRTVLGVLDDGATGLASGARADGQGLGRAAGNSINALLDAWTLTSEKKYLEFAEALIRRCIHPNDDIDSRQLLDIERSWSYTVFLRSLAKYLDLKAQAEQFDRMHAYGQASLVHYASWMLANERPYFDQVEKLEFPTEAWAAQELRKANVLRLAARHVDDPLRTQLLDRGDELGDRAWSDLMRFETRATARALAIVMTEGRLDYSLRRRISEPAPRPLSCDNFGEPIRFIPQRQRLKTVATNPVGLVRLVGRLASSQCWARHSENGTTSSDAAR